MTSRSQFVVSVLVFLFASLQGLSFVPPGAKRRSSSCNRHNGFGGGSCNNHNNGGNIPPSSPGFSSGWHDEDENHDGMSLLGGLLVTSSFRADSRDNAKSKPIINKGDNEAIGDEGCPSMRGGSTQAVAEEEKSSGMKAALSKTASFWSKVLSSAGSSLLAPFRFVSSRIPFMFSRESREQKALIAELRSTPIQSVVVRQNSTVLPPEVVSSVAEQSGLIGNPISQQAIQDIARSLQQWYMNKGYLLSSVTGASLDASSATAEIEVEEPLVSNMPVSIAYFKEMVLDNGQVTTFRQYKEKLVKEKGSLPVNRSDLNTTYVPTSGKTNPKRIARALQLEPGKPFQWHGDRWQSVLSSGIFGQILNASPQRMDDGTVQLNVLATERPPRKLEYGMTKSLYTGLWEGELDFVNGNVFGGGEVVGLTVRRGTKDAETSAKLRFSDSKFGQAGGYNVDLFSEFIGDQLRSENEGNDVTDYDHDALLSRKGATVRFQNPLDPNRIRQTSSSASLERTSTRSGHHESLASGTLDVGPFYTKLPMDARSSVAASLCTGARLLEEKIGNKNEPLSAKVSWSNVRPFSSGSVTTRQVVPLLADKVTLALSHTIMTSSSNFPRHEANSAGISSFVRGYDTRSNGPIASSIMGTTELRIPVRLPTDKLRQDAGIVLYSDWLVARSYRSSDSPGVRKSSVGVGVRKSVQGVPLRYDVSYTKDGQIGASFGMGSDFDV